MKSHSTNHCKCSSSQMFLPKKLKQHAQSRDINSNTKSSSFALVFSAYRWRCHIAALHLQAGASSVSRSTVLMIDGQRQRLINYRFKIVWVTLSDHLAYSSPVSTSYSGCSAVSLRTSTFIYTFPVLCRVQWVSDPTLTSTTLVLVLHKICSIAGFFFPFCSIRTLHGIFDGLKWEGLKKQVAYGLGTYSKLWFYRTENEQSIFYKIVSSQKHRAKYKKQPIYCTSSKTGTCALPTSFTTCSAESPGKAAFPPRNSK